MKPQTGVFAGLLIACALSSGAALAYGGGAVHGGGHFHGGHHHHSGARVGVGVSFGIPFGPYYYPYYYPPAYYYGPSYYQSPVVVAPASPPVYIERGADGTPVLPPQASQQYPSGYWYYCGNPQGYYPYVKDCPGGWQQVSPQPAQQ